jgi:hypothetical protein
LPLARSDPDPGGDGQEDCSRLHEKPGQINQATSSCGRRYSVGEPNRSPSRSGKITLIEVGQTSSVTCNAEDPPQHSIGFVQPLGVAADDARWTTKEAPWSDLLTTISSTCPSKNHQRQQKPDKIRSRSRHPAIKHTLFLIRTSAHLSMLKPRRCLPISSFPWHFKEADYSNPKNYPAMQPQTTGDVQLGKARSWPA